MFNQSECYPKNRGGDSQIFKHFWQYAACLFLAFVLGIGQMWGEDLTATYSVADLISASKITSSSTNNQLDQTIGNITFDWNKNSSSSDVKISSGRVQLFGDGQTLTISTTSIYRIKSIKFTVGNKSNSPTAIAVSPSSGTSWDPAFTSSTISNADYTFTVASPIAASSYVFTSYKSGGTNQRIDFPTIVVTYDLAPVANPTVTYYANEATSGSAPIDPNSPYTNGDKVTVLGNTGNLAKTNFVFAGWNTKADGTGNTYQAGDVISNVTVNTSLYALWEYPTTGTGTLEYALTYDKNEVAPSVSGVSTLSSSSAAFSLTTLTIGVNSDKKPGYSAKIEGATSTTTNNVALQFSVADGYTFTPSSVDMTIFANSTSYMKAKVVLTDGTTSVESEELSCASSADSEISFASSAFTNVKFEGDIDVIVYLWLTSGSGKRAYIKSPVTITGTVAVATPACGATAPGDISAGDLTDGEITLTAEGSAETGDTWYWQSASDGTSTSDEYDAENGKTVDAAGTYYLRSYNTAGTCWSTAKSITLTAEDFVAHYAITYNKGAYVQVMQSQPVIRQRMKILRFPQACLPVRAMFK